MKTILKWRYKNLKIRQKILLFYIPLILLPLLTVVLISNNIFVKAVTDITKKNIEEESTLIQIRVEGIISDTQTCATMVIRNINTIYKDYTQSDNDSVSFVSIQNQLTNALSYDAGAFKDIDSIIYIDNKYNVVSSCPVLVDKDELKKNEIIQNLMKSGPPTNVWYPMEIRNTLTRNDKSPILSYGKKVINENTGKVMGYLVINVKEETLSSIYNFDSKTGDKTYCLIDKDGVCVSAVDKNLLFTEPFPGLHISEEESADNWSSNILIKNEQYIFASTRIEKVDLFLVCQMKLAVLTKEAKVNETIVILVGGLCVLGAFAATTLLSNVIARPIVKLTKVAGEVRTGNLRIKSDIDSQDEIGTLALVFNEMIYNTEEFIERIKLEQKKKKEFELALIQAQINPHFLYNTLDLIYVLCEMKENNLAAETTKSLADFYRISLSQGRTMITIKEEIQNVKDYLQIQGTRYKDILEYEFDIAENIGDCPILKLTLQPIVENAIYHGIKPQNGGKIHIRGYETDDAVILEVEDNGQGIDKEKVKLLNRFEELKEKRASFGLSNVDERIKLYFGQEYGLHVYSTLKEGTKIVVRLPKENRGKGSNV